MIIHIVEDQPLMLSAMVKCLQSEPWVDEILLDTNGEDALSTYFSERPQLLILDVELPKLSGLQVAKEIENSGSKPRILMISGYANEAILCGVSRLKGVHGFLFKEGDFFTTLKEAVRRISGGNFYYGETYREHMSKLLFSGKRLDRILSFEERRILALLGAGWSDEQIAMKLLITTGTVHWHTQQMRNKLGLKSTRELILLAYKSGLASASWEDMDLVDHFDIP